MSKLNEKRTDRINRLMNENTDVIIEQFRALCSKVFNETVTIIEAQEYLVKIGNELSAKKNK